MAYDSGDVWVVLQGFVGLLVPVRFRNLTEGNFCKVIIPIPFCVASGNIQSLTVGVGVAVSIGLREALRVADGFERLRRLKGVDGLFWLYTVFMSTESSNINRFRRSLNICDIFKRSDFFTISLFADCRCNIEG